MPVATKARQNGMYIVGAVCTARLGWVWLDYMRCAFIPSATKAVVRMQRSLSARVEIQFATYLLTETESSTVRFCYNVDNHNIEIP